MASPYNLQIVNGVATQAILNGEYTATAQVTGYSNTSLLPTSLQVVSGTDEYSFTIAATGTLTLHVSENGMAGGQPVVGATFVRCDSNGTAYGTPIVSDEDGLAVFANVPFAETSAPLIYYRQTASDGEHEFDNTLKSTTMNSSAATLEIENTPPAVRTIRLTDSNYEGLPVEMGTITLTSV